MVDNDGDGHIFALTLPSRKCFMVFHCLLFFFFQNQLFQKVLSRIPSECQIDWIQIRPHILWG